MSDQHRVEGIIVDIFRQELYPGRVWVEAGKILRIEKTGTAAEPALLEGPFILPGFIDAHVHIESSMLVPAAFAQLAVVHGTVGTVSDPHEIANVCGMEGVEFMLKNGSSVPFHFSFGAPSCVPATALETAGAALDAEQVAALLMRPEIKYLSEMMNFPGVLQREEEVMLKLEAALRADKPVDGHAPGLRGEAAKLYIESGISTDHECFTIEEAREKLRYGMKIIIREGSAARNFDALVPLLAEAPDMIMFGSDDKHPDSLVEGHINLLVQRAVASGMPLFSVLKAACINPVLHYKLPSGMLRAGDSADFIVVNNLKDFHLQETWIKGNIVASGGKAHFSLPEVVPVNKFRVGKKSVEDFHYPLQKWGEEENMEQVYVIEALDGQLITNKILANISIVSDPQNPIQLRSNVEEDVLKMVVVNRYQPAPIAKTFVKNFGLKAGAIASSVAHDSHNIIAVGVDDYSIAEAINKIIQHQGGISLHGPAGSMVIPLPVAGLMSTESGHLVAEAYSNIDRMAKELGSTLRAPFMTLSFMALLVIPHLKLSDMGLVACDENGIRLV
jgi:adenine deaminase